MKTEKLNEIRTLKKAASTVGSFWQTYRDKYLSDRNCDKKNATFVQADDRFSAFSFTLRFSAHAGYYGNSSCSRIFSLDNELAGKYFTRAIQANAEALFRCASELMLKDAAALTEEAEKEVAALQAMLDEVRATGAAE